MKIKQLQTVMVPATLDDTTPTGVFSLNDNGTTILYLDKDDNIDIRFDLVNDFCVDYSEAMRRAIELELVWSDTDTGVVYFTFPNKVYIAYLEEYVYILRGDDILRLYMDDNGKRYVQVMCRAKDSINPKDATAVNPPVHIKGKYVYSYLQQYVEYIFNKPTLQ